MSLEPYIHFTNLQSLRPGSNEISFGVGMCFPQSCSPEVLAKLVNRAIPRKIREKITVHIQEDWCQFEDTPPELRTIDWITM